MQTVSFSGCVLQHSLRLRTERNFYRCRHSLPSAVSLNLPVHVGVGELCAREDRPCEPLVVPQQPEEDVLGLNRHAAKLRGLEASEEERAPRRLAIAFEHRRSFSSQRRLRIDV